MAASKSAGETTTGVASSGRRIDADESRAAKSERRPPASMPGRPRRPQRFARSWPLQTTTVRLARVHARTWLTIGGWAGDQHAALLAIHELVENGVKHSLNASADDVVGLALLIAEDEDLLIDVSDPNPRFAEFDAATAGGRSTGLGLVIALGGSITWGTPDPDRGKTVRIRFRPGETPASQGAAGTTERL